MKFLGNPWLTGTLVMVAVGLVIYQVLGTTGRGHASVAAEPVAYAAPPAVPAPALAVPAAPEPALVLDRKFVELHLSDWLTKSQRDVFTAPVVKHFVPSTNGMASRWHLKAIWAQTGSRVAAINNSVYSEGDHIEELTVERIEDTQVWLKGPEGRELVEFESSRTNAPGKNKSAPPSLANRQGETQTPK